MESLRTTLASVAAGLGVLLATAPVMAHHSFAAEFDRNKPVKVTGVITEVEWRNPHIWFYVSVKDENGTTTIWGFSGAPPGMLARRGVTRDVLKPGDIVVVQGFRARDGSNNASGGSVTFADGRRVFTAAATDPTPQ